MRTLWALRVTLVAVLPATILAFHPVTRPFFVYPTIVVEFAYWPWDTPYTLGSTLGRLSSTLKGMIIGVLLSMAAIQAQPVTPQQFLPLFAAMIFVVVLLFEQSSKTACYFVAVLMLQYYSDPR